MCWWTSFNWRQLSFREHARVEEFLRPIQLNSQVINRINCMAYSVRSLAKARAGIQVCSREMDFTTRIPISFDSRLVHTFTWFIFSHSTFFSVLHLSGTVSCQIEDLTKRNKICKQFWMICCSPILTWKLTFARLWYNVDFDDLVISSSLQQDYQEWAIDLYSKSRFWSGSAIICLLLNQVIFRCSANTTILTVVVCNEI